LSTQFRGWKKGAILELQNGSWWEQTSLDLTLVLLLQPRVVLVPESTQYRAYVDGADGSALVKKLEVVYEGNIAGDFEGWDTDAVFELDGGQIWRQTSYQYSYSYAYRPRAIIFANGSGYRMIVEGMQETIDVERLN
jgi:hypothetical protein